MTEPTQEQIKEFWEWCGFEYKHEEVVDASAKKVFITSTWLNGIETAIPDIDLSNLFKYAVPKLVDKYGGILFILPQSDILSWECKILNKPGDAATFGHSIKDPALALFWAIWKVIHDE